MEFNREMQEWFPLPFPFRMRAVMEHRGSELAGHEIPRAAQARSADVISNRANALHPFLVRLLFKPRNMHMERSIGELITAVPART